MNSDPNDGDESPSNKVVVDAPLGAGTGTINQSFPLIENSHVYSDLVAQLQVLLNERLATIPNNGVFPKYNGITIKQLNVDGYYGPRTAAVVYSIFLTDKGKKVTQAQYLSLLKPINSEL